MPSYETELSQINENNIRKRVDSPIEKETFE